MPGSENTSPDDQDASVPNKTVAAQRGRVARRRTPKMEVEVVFVEEPFEDTLRRFIRATQILLKGAERRAAREAKEANLVALSGDESSFPMARTAATTIEAGQDQRTDEKSV